MLFSIIVPVYGIEKYIRKCLDTILEQTYQDFEVIVVDDGSRDNCPGICDEYGKKDKRIRVIHQENQGLVAARNNGLMQAKGDYICHVDGDDWLAADYLEKIARQISNAPKQPDVVLFGAYEVFRDKMSPILNYAKEGFYTNKQVMEKIAPDLLVEKKGSSLRIGRKILGACWNKCYRREYLLEHYCHDTKIKMGEDIAFTHECVLFAQYVMICNDIIYYYNRTNETSMTAVDKRRGLDENRARLIDYMFQRMQGSCKEIDEQLNLYATLYMIRGAIDQCLHSDKPAKDFERAVKMSGLLNRIDDSQLSGNTKLFIKMIRCGLYKPAMILVKRKIGKGRPNV